MARESLEVADIFRAQGPAWRSANAGHLSLAAEEFIRRFRLHVLPQGFHRIRHYGLFANGGRSESLALARKLLDVEPHQDAPDPEETDQDAPTCNQPCPCCGGAMIVIETFEPGQEPRPRRSRDPPACQAARA